MKAVIENVDIDDAKTLLQYAYDQDGASTYQGAWQTKRHVHGSIILASWDAYEGTVTLNANALSTHAGLRKYVHPDYREDLNFLVADAQ